MDSLGAASRITAAAVIERTSRRTRIGRTADRGDRSSLAVAGSWGELKFRDHGWISELLKHNTAPEGPRNGPAGLCSYCNNLDFRKTARHDPRTRNRTANRCAVRTNQAKLCSPDPCPCCLASHGAAPAPLRNTVPSWMNGCDRRQPEWPFTFHAFGCYKCAFKVRGGHVAGLNGEHAG